MSGVVRGWYVAHRGTPALAAGGVTAALAAGYGATSIAVWDTVRQFPLWALVPGTLVMIAGTTLDGRLDAWPAVHPSAVRRARTWWVAATTGCTTALAVPTALALDNRVIVSATFVLFVASFAPALLDIRLATATGGAVNLAAVAMLPRIDVNQSVADFLTTMPSGVWQALLGIGAIGIASYVWRGPRKLGGRVVPG